MTENLADLTPVKAWRQKLYFPLPGSLAGR